MISFEHLQSDIDAVRNALADCIIHPYLRLRAQFRQYSVLLPVLPADAAAPPLKLVSIQLDQLTAIRYFRVALANCNRLIALPLRVPGNLSVSSRYPAHLSTACTFMFYIYIYVLRRKIVDYCQRERTVGRALLSSLQLGASPPTALRQMMQQVASELSVLINYLCNLIFFSRFWKPARPSAAFVCYLVVLRIDTSQPNKLLTTSKPTKL